MSKCIASNPEQYEKGKGNLTTGVKKSLSTGKSMGMAN